MGATKLNFELLSANNAVFSCYITWCCLLFIKVLAMGPFTGIMRMKTKSFENPEDVAKGIEVGNKNENVERIRRAHLNDLENAIPFAIVALFYVLTNPNPLLAMMLIRIAVIARFGHTVVYAIYPVRQPARAICFFTMYGITLFMAIYCIICFHGF